MSSIKGCAGFLGHHHSPETKAKMRAGHHTQESKKAFIRAAKDKPCADCGHVFHHTAMDFDHRLGTTKRFDLSHTGTRCLKTIQEEIVKCDVVCANCHRVRTFERQQVIAEAVCG